MTVKLEKIEQSGRVFHLIWDNGIHIQVCKIREQRNGDLRGQVTVSNGDVVLHQAMMNLSIDSSRNSTIKTLIKIDSKKPWTTIISELCLEVGKRIAQGFPMEIIMTDQEVKPKEYLLHPILPLNDPTIIFGLGGAVKSYLAELIAITVQLPWLQNSFGWKIKDNKSHNVLYLDWETDRDNIHWRGQRIVTGMNLYHVAFAYRRCVASLVDDLETIEKLISDYKTELVIIDSVARACGGDLKETPVVNPFFTALRELNRTTLLIHHRAKDDIMARKTPYGSVYFENNARSVWHIERAKQVGDTISIALTQIKANDSGQIPPLGMQITFDDDSQATKFEPLDIKDSPFAHKQPLWERLRDSLSQGGKMQSELTEEMDTSEENVRRTLYRRPDIFTRTGKGFWELIENVQNL